MTHAFTLLTSLFLLPVFAFAQTTQPAIPADGDSAAKALAASPRHGEWADIKLPGSEATLHTWVVYPERKDKAPVVIVIHEIFGMTDWVRGVADRLAADGYVAVAPDLLSGKGPNGGGTEAFSGDTVRAAIQKLTPDEVVQRLDAAREYAIKLPSASEKVGTVGFCWGGGASFNYAARQPKLNAAVVFYGTPPTDQAAFEKIGCAVAGFYGGDDARVTATVPAAEAAMTKAKKTYKPHVFDGAGHGFMRQQTGRDGKNLTAAQMAWEETLAFFKQHLR